MTGFGTADGAVGALHLSVEVRTVNHRFFNPSIKLPSAFARWEGEVREALRAGVARGHVSLSARVMGTATDATAPDVLAIDEVKFAAYVARLRELQARHGLSADLDVATILRLPDVLVAESNAPPKPDDGNGIRGWAQKLFQKQAGAVTPSANRIVLLRDADGDGIAETRSVFISGLHSPFGMVLVGHDFYVADTDAIMKFPYREGDTKIDAPGVKLADAGISVQQLIAEHCGGMQDGHQLYAYLPGGASGGILPASLGHLPLDFDTLQPHGCFIGSAAVMVLSQHDSAVAAARNLMRFFKHESCGQCTPCRNGTAKALALIEQPHWDLALLADLSAVMRDASICGLGQAAPNPVDCVVKYFAHELA